MSRKLQFTLLAIVAVAIGLIAYKKSRHKLKIVDDPMDSIEVDAELEVHIRAERECQLGDFDIIFGDLSLTGSTTKTNLLLSIEPLVPAKSSFKIQTKRISPAAIDSGFTVKFPIGKISEREHLGVFLCRDVKHTGRCVDKKVYDYGVIEQSLQRNGDSKVRNDDKVFFFQYLLAEKNRLNFLTENVKSLQEAFTEIDKATASVSDQINRSAIREKTKQLYDALGSYVVVKSPQKNRVTMEILLSQLDKSKCQNTNTPTVPIQTRVFRGQPVSPVFQKMGFDKK